MNSILRSRIAVLLLSITFGIGTLYGSERRVKIKKGEKEYFKERVKWKKAAAAAAGGGAIVVSSFAFVGKNWFKQRGDKDSNNEDPKNEGPKIDFQSGKSSDINAAIIPHAGLTYSGEVISEVFSQVDWDKYDTILLFSASHKVRNNHRLPEHIRAIGLPNDLQGFADIAHVRTLKDFIQNKSAIEADHAPQIVFPFIHEINTHKQEHGKHRIKIIPLLIGETVSDRDIEAIHTYLSQHPNTFLLANTDLLHQEGVNERNSDDMRKFDKDTIQNIQKAIQNPDRLIHANRLYDNIKPKVSNQSTMCGFHAIETFVRIAHDLGLTDKKYIHSDSLKVAQKIDEKSNKYVGYLGMTLAPQEGMSGVFDSDDLKALAAKVLRENSTLLRDRGATESEIQNIALTQYARDNDEDIEGIFVTINNGKTLRGCIGNFRADKEQGEKRQGIHYWVARQTLESALFDKRFNTNPITESELPSLSFEISILNKSFQIYPEKLGLTPFQAFWEHYQQGHGIRVTFERAARSVTYLPSVFNRRSGAIENIFEDLMKQLRSEKAHVAPDAKIIKMELYATKVL